MNAAVRFGAGPSVHVAGTVGAMSPLPIATTINSRWILFTGINSQPGSDDIRRARAFRRAGTDRVSRHTHNPKLNVTRTGELPDTASVADPDRRGGHAALINAQCRWLHRSGLSGSGKNSPCLVTGSI